jgi:group I intron endonuclease
MKLVLIYTLKDPIDGLIKYVGKTSQKLEKRLHAHISESKKKNDKKSNWINLLTKQGLKPIIEEIDEVSENNWEFWEKYWISQLKSWNIDLKNGNEGGKGQSSTFMKNNNPMFKEENRKKLSSSLIGNSFAKGFKHSEETKRKVSENNSKYWLGKKRDKKMVDNTSLKVSKPIVQMDLSGNIIQKFDSVRLAVKSKNFDRTSIYKCLSGKQYSYKNFFWLWDK